MGNTESNGSKEDTSAIEEEGGDHARHSMPVMRSTSAAQARARAQFAHRRHSVGPPIVDERTTSSGHGSANEGANAAHEEEEEGHGSRHKHRHDVERGGIEQGQQATEEATNQLGYWYLLKNGYSQLVNLIIRPPRAKYEPKDLGPSEFSFSGRNYHRVDFSVENDRKQKLHCSQWLPVETEIEGVSTFPCVIYLHGNSSCRLEALSVLRPCLSAGVTVVAFDCAGSGLSDGDYISLGYFERDDLRAVMQYLRDKGNISTIGLWGRSMGAATAILHADRDPSIGGIIVDSAFTNLEQLVQEIVERGRQEGFTIPSLLVKICMRFVRSSVLKRAGFDIRELSPLAHCAMAFVPALFIAARGDDFVAPHHSDQLYESYAGDKNIIKVAGDHNSTRPHFMLDSAGIFLQTTLQVDPRLLPDSDMMEAMLRTAPAPWGDEDAAASHIMMMDVDAALAGNGADMPRPSPDKEWICTKCTYINSPLVYQCEICHTAYQAAVSDGTATPIAISPPRRRSSTPSGGVNGRFPDVGEEDCLTTPTPLSTSDPLSSRARMP